MMVFEGTWFGMSLLYIRDLCGAIAKEYALLKQ